MPVIQLPANAAQFFLSISESKYVFLLLINILLPVIAKFGIDPVHFGMVMLLNLGVGLVTPPVGPAMVIGCAIGRVSMEAITKELWPFYGAMCLVLILVTYVPELSLWLPRMFGR